MAAQSKKTSIKHNDRKAKASPKGSSKGPAKGQISKKASRAERRAAREKERAKEAAKGRNGRKASAKQPNILKRFANYLHAVRLELKRAVWPTRREVRNQTIVVLAALVFFGVLIYLVDSAVNPLLVVYSNLLG